ncbi:hypothetical protein SNE25_13870 [Mucilaginibacter sabulilitoris]|uniref:Uncharacterized protein n=1 Tax=Mucilaginibacter sabulilitoris TaxID=1173583 RepID=A0ABZ0TV22_9SPHI|nr:hypothetical protein [Mucilaginibacter sabulilitoris]WPU96606.1 hypothetical protein SNE25_13870 [Mucilaginibacter sabulilitoris]
MKSPRVLKKTGLIAVFLLNLFFTCAAQQHADSVAAAGKPLNNSDSTVLTFLHIKHLSVPITNVPGWRNPKAFKLKYKTDNIDWTSPALIPLDNDSLGFLVKVRIPLNIYKLHPMFTCNAAAMWGGPESDRENWSSATIVSYDGVTARGIQLQLVSNPVKAEVYLIPRRVWLNRIQNSNWQKNNVLIEAFLVDSDKTNTSVGIDETVYTVIFKLGDKYLIRTHYTKPLELEPIQKVSVDF